jgi:hypothetical protein
MVNGSMKTGTMNRPLIHLYIVASTERGEPLRKMVLPRGLHAKFLTIAEPNTRNKIETCGILAGTLVKKKKKKNFPSIGYIV